jgi:hypothetical protein
MVRWDDGEKARIAPRDRSVGYASEGSRALEWLLEPGLAEEAFDADPIEVLTEFIRDAGRVTTTMLVRRVSMTGIPEDAAASAYAKSREALKANPHILIKGQSNVWSDEPVDPYAHLRRLSPHDALDQLGAAKGLRPPMRAALADAVRAALPPRT